MRTKPKVFLSYAREDLALVSRLYDELSAAGLDPWLDRRNLIGGELWDHKIRKAIRQSDFFLACLSSHSVNKRGFLQREIRQALDLWQEKLDDDIYLIPTRLEECQVPESLSKFQWVDLFEDEGLTSLLEAVRIGVKRQRVPLKVETPSGDLTAVTKTIRETEGGKPKYVIEIDYPQVQGLEEAKAEEINLSLQGFVLNRIHRFKGGATSFSLRDAGEHSSELYIDYDVPLLTSRLLSLRFSIYEYYAGAAHGMTYTRTFNYEFGSPLLIDLGHLFKTHADYLKIVSDHCVQELRAQAAANGDEPDNLFLDGASAEWKNFRAFNITDRSLSITFEPYQVDCYAAGTKHVEVPYAAIQKHLDGDVMARLLPHLGSTLGLDS
jgi:hypothetical protein